MTLLKLPGNFYVYQHRDADGKVFYIGSGDGKRAFSESSRNGDWESVSHNGFSVEILSTHETLEEAEKAEYAHINRHPKLTNKVKARSSKLPNKRGAIVCLENSMRFPSCAAAARWVSETEGKHTTRMNITDAVNGVIKTAYGYTWKRVLPA